MTRRFLTYESLPATEANLALLDLAVQHPTASVDASLELEGVSGPKGR